MLFLTFDNAVDCALRFVFPKLYVLYPEAKLDRAQCWNLFNGGMRLSIFPDCTELNFFI